MDLQSEYERILTAAENGDAPSYFVEMSRLFAREAIWKSYDGLVAALPRGFAGGTAVDIGCKYGHALPVFLFRGASHAVGVDVVDEYLDAGRRILGALYPTLRFAKSDDGFLPLPPSSVDFVLVNEVISHVNPMFLENLYGEIGRILKRGGQVLISDGNNIANAECRKALVELYDAWENGPSGRRTDRDTVTTSFLDRRGNIIRARHPGLAEDKQDYLARNTSGLFGPLLDRVIDEYVGSGSLVERPFRPGVCPTNPGPGGEVMERGFYPQQVEMSLASYGIRAHQILPPPPPLAVSGVRGTIRSLAAVLRDRLRRRFDPDAERGASWGFQILGVKES
jgi:SAM-dependent methyltransferase